MVLETNTQLGMTPKKAHEVHGQHQRGLMLTPPAWQVSRLAGVVVEHACRRCGCEAVIDIGSGLVCVDHVLGYLHT